MKKSYQVFIMGIVLCTLLTGAVYFHTQVSRAVIMAGKRCFLSVLPSLYLFSILAAFFVKSGILEGMAKPFQRFCQKVFKTDALLLMIVFFSQIGGYPVGAQLVHSLYQEGRISEAQERTLLCVCMGCGFGFLLGTVHGNPSTVLFIWLVMSVPNFFLALLFLRNMYTEIRNESRQNQKAFAVLLTESVESAASAMLKVSAMILAFAALMGIAEGIFSNPDDIIRSMLEISNLSGYAQNGSSLPMTAALLSFGGICVHLQIGAVCENHMAWGKFWLCRIVTSVMTYGLCRLGLHWIVPVYLPVFLSETQLSAVRSSSLSMIPGCCLAVMSVFVLKKYDFCNKILTNLKK